MDSDPQADKMRRTVDSLTGELLTVYEELALLYSLGTQFGRLTGEEQITSLALREAMDILRADCGWLVLLDEKGSSHMPDGCRVAVEAHVAERLNDIIVRPMQEEFRHQVLSDALQEDYPINETGVPARFLACALESRETPIGYICLGRRPQERSFNSADQKLIDALALLTAVAVENIRLQRAGIEKQRLTNELDLALRIQQSLLPQDFSGIGFVDACGVSVPCFEIGGDYYDLFPVAPDRCVMVMADVCGKGPAAALGAARVQGIVQAVSKHAQHSSQYIRTINTCIRDRVVKDSFVTAFVATLDAAGQLEYSNGGHNPPLWIQTNGSVSELHAAGPLLGFVDNPECPQGRNSLSPGDLLVMYTDGVTDAENPRGESFGAGRLMEWAGSQAGCRAAVVQQSLIGAVTQFCEGYRHIDDITVLVVRLQAVS
jgi:serine phosphatase RsbU (regulator of sigma subunit)